MDLTRKRYIIDNLKWPFNYLNYLSNYIILIGPIAIIYISISEYMRGNPMLTSLLVGIIFFFFIISRINQERKFKELIISQNTSTSEIIAALEKERWKIINESDDVLKFQTRITGFSWGEIITIIRVGDRLLINTQSRGKFAFTFFKEIVNYNLIKSVIESRSANGYL